jgi:hypothetical protein
VDEGQIEQAIVDRFKAQVTDVISIPTYYDNPPEDEDGPPATSTQWCRVSVRFGAAFQAERTSVGRRKFIIPGALIVQVFTPPGMGTKPATDTTKTIRDAFRALTAGGVTYKTPSAPHIGRTGGYWQTNVTVDFWAEDDG